MRRALTILKAALVLGLVGLAILLLWGHARRHPEDMPWTEVDLTRPIGAFTGRKLAGLRGDAPRCHALLARAGIRFTALPPRRAGAECGHDGAVRFIPGGSLRIAWRPDDLGTSCAVAAGLALWEWHVVQPAALRRFGRRVAAIEHYGSYSCRRVYGRSEGPWSQHATANAVDIAAFRLEDGTRIAVLADWRGSAPSAGFLRDVRGGACRLFTTVLSPDYNEAHRDHLHLDQAPQGTLGWRACR